MEKFLVKIEKSCFFCDSFPGCPIHVKMGRALEAFDGYKIKALYYALSEVCEFFGKYREDPEVVSRYIEQSTLRRIVKAAEQGKVIALGKISQNGVGSETKSVFLQGIYDTEEEERFATKDMDIVPIRRLNSVSSSAPALK